MTVNTLNITSGPYSGNDVADQFSYTFRIEEKDQLRVFETNASGDTTELTVDTDYTVAGIGDDGGGTLTRSSGPLPSGFTWFIRSNYIPTQDVAFGSQGGFFPEVHEGAFDKTTFLIQQLYDLNNRNLKISPSEPLGANLEIPNAADRASKVLTFGLDGGVEVEETPTDLLLRQELSSSPSTGKGASLVNGAATYVGSVAELEAWSLSVGTSVYLTQDGRAGEFVVKSGTPPSDPQKGVYIVLANGNYAERIEKQNLNVGHFGATYSGDESVIAQAMVDLVNEYRIPKGKVFTAKNTVLKNNTVVDFQGAHKMPNGCADFDRAIYGYGLSGLDIFISEIDGNAAGQSGNIGTHLIYLVDISDSDVVVKYAHDHYYFSGGTVGPAGTDGGNRNASTGAIYVLRGENCDVTVEYLNKWGREGVQLRDCTSCEVWCGHLESSLGAEYSGLQVRGDKNKVHRVSVNNALGSAVGFDTTNGSISNVIATGTRVFAGLNFGHPNTPASNSVASNIVIDKSFKRGIQVSSSTKNLKISNFSVTNSGDYGIGVSDGSDNISLTSGDVRFSQKSNILIGGASVNASNTGISELDPKTLKVNTATGLFVDGETISSSGGGSGVVRTSVPNTTAAEQFLFLSSVTGTLASGETITGGTSGNTATIETVDTPSEITEQSGGLYIPDQRTFPNAAQFDQIRYKDGTAVMSGVVTFTTTSTTSAETKAITYFSNILWSEAPTITASITSFNNTSNFNVNLISPSLSSTTGFTLYLKTTAAQTYGIAINAVGRWK